MTTTKQKRKGKWEKEHVQRVLDYHNKEHGTHIAIKGKTTDIYPHLRGQPNWDWVCRHVETGEEIALEVKKLTDPKLEEKSNVMWELLKEVRDSLSDKLPGTFCLFVNTPQDYYLPIGKINESRNRQEFKSVISKAIYRTAQNLKLAEKEDLKPQIIEQLPFMLPDLFLCNLLKVSDDGSVLGLHSGGAGVWSPWLNEHELKKFEQLISHANEQLSVAQKEFNVKETFLVIIDEGYRIADPDTVAEAFKRINHGSYSCINHVYYLSGEEMAEIPVPTP